MTTMVVQKGHHGHWREKAGRRYMLCDQVPYQELGPDYFDQRHTQQLERHYVRRLEALGFQVALTPASKPRRSVIQLSSPNRVVREQFLAVVFSAGPHGIFRRNALWGCLFLYLFSAEYYSISTFLNMPSVHP